MNLTLVGHECLQVFDGEAALSEAENTKYDLIILDVMLPKMSGFEVIEALEDTAVIFVTAKIGVSDRIKGLKLGADDYITKPFSMRELMARIKANVRRSSAPTLAVEAEPVSDGNTLVFGNIVINLKSLDVRKNGEVLDLTPREFELIKFLATQPNQVFSREALMENVWKYDYYGDLRTVDVTVRRLREKIEDDPANPVRIVTRRGAGYMFAD